MKRFRLLAFCMGMLTAMAGFAQEQNPGLFSATGDVTIITSDKLTFDYQKHYALFEQNVLVDDPQMKLNSDTLTAQFDDNNKVQLIIAEGHVRIRQEDKTAWADTGTYNVETGEIRLEGNPRVQRDNDLLAGDIITFWRDENKMVVEPRARLLIFPDEEGGGKKQLFGE